MNDNPAPKQIVELPASNNPWFTRVIGNEIILFNQDHPQMTVKHLPGYDLEIIAVPLPPEPVTIVDIKAERKTDHELPR